MALDRDDDVWTDQLLVLVPWLDRDLPHVGDIDAASRLLRNADIDASMLRQLLAPTVRVEQLEDDEVIDAVAAMMASGRRVLVATQALHADTSRRPDESEASWAAAPLLSELLPSSALPEAIPRPTWVEIEVVGEFGLLVKDATLTIRFPDGQERTQALDAAGRFRADDVGSEGFCQVSLQTPIDLAPPDSAPGELPVSDALVAHDRSTVVSLSTTRFHRIAVTRPRVHIVELQDAGFESAGKVLRPDARELDDGAIPVASSLRCIAAALERAFADPTLRVWVAGHADTVGDDEDNAVLSQERAANVQLFLAGRSTEWAAHCQAHYTVGDFEAAYRFVARTFGWDCDPASVDDDFDDASRTARDNFRARHTEETGTPLERHVKQNEADWEAIFVMYRRALAQTMGLSPDELGQRCAALQFLDPPTVGCGEQFPKAAVDTDGFASAANRRVDLVLVQASDIDYLASPPDAARIYGACRVFRRIGVYVPIGDEPLAEFVSQLVDENDEPVPGQRYELVLPDGTMLEGHGDAEGFVRVPDVPIGICRLVYPDLDAREWNAIPIGPRPLPAIDPAAQGVEEPEEPDVPGHEDHDLEDADLEGEIPASDSDVDDDDDDAEVA